MKRQPSKFAFTLLELLGIIATVAGLAGLVLPGVGRAKARAPGSQCMSNLRQWGLTGVGSDAEACK
jgi:type II secretory pathway pseudopilin PulG